MGMGLLGHLGAGLSAAGGAVADVGLAGVKAGLEQQKIQLASDLADRNNAAQGERTNAFAVAAEGRAPALAAAKITAEGGATEALAAQNAPAQLARKIADTTATHQAVLDFNTDPTNIAKQSAADAAKAKLTANAAADLTGELLQRPDYVKNLNTIALADPVKRAQIAASMSQVAKSQYELGQEKVIDAAKVDLGNTQPGTPEFAAAKARVSALEWSVTSDRAQQAADSAVMTSIGRSIHDDKLLIANIATPDDIRDSLKEGLANKQAIYNGLLARYTGERGVAAPSPKPVAGVQVGTGADAGKVMVDGVVIPGTAATPADVKALVEKYRSEKGRTSTGLINQIR